MPVDEILPELRDRPVFICGHPKAGTSLLRALLDSHPQLVVYPEETLFFRRYLPLVEGQAPTVWVATALESLLHIFTWNTETPPANQDGYLDRDYTWIGYENVKGAFLKLVDTMPLRHPGDVLSAAMLAFGQAMEHLNPNTRAWVEKTPYNERFAAQIFAWWPEARCIHVVRDPRDNYASYQRKHADWDEATFALRWAKSTRLGMQNEAHFGKTRYRVVRYEDLVRAPAQVMADIADFLGVAMHPNLLMPTRAGRSWQGNSMFADRFQAISTRPVGRWRERLSPDEAALVEWMTARWMDALRYPREMSYPWRIRLRGWYWQVRMGLYAWKQGMRKGEA